jgi:hypothetical protein
MTLKDQLSAEAVVHELKQYPQNFARIANGVLLLFAIASVIAGWGRSDLGTFILIAAVVFGFALGVLGFERLARARSVFYARLGMVLITLTLGAILSLFVTVLVYVGTGSPIWLDTFFHPGPPAAAPKASIDEVSDRRLVLRLEPYQDDRATIEASLFAHGGEFPIAEPQRVRATTERVYFESLTPATVYRVRIVAMVRGRPSSPLDLWHATNAVDLQVEPFGDAGANSTDILYSGPINLHGQPDGSSATLKFVNVSTGGEWTYLGPVRQGRPHGRGSLSRTLAGSSDGCPGPYEGCFSMCETIDFNFGELVSGECSLVVNPATWREGQRSFQVEGWGNFFGHVAGASEDHNRSEISSLIGPFPVVFHGKGVLHTALDDLIAGSWSRGALNGPGSVVLSTSEERHGEFENGLLKKGAIYNKPFPEGEAVEYRSYEIIEFGPSRAAIQLGSNSFQIGTANGSNLLLPGFHGRWSSEAFEVIRYPGNAPAGKRFVPTDSPTNPDCVYDEDFGLGIDGQAPSNPGWELWTINRNADRPGEPTVAITLELPSAEIWIRGFRWANGPADIRFWLGNNFDRKQEVSIDGFKMELGGAVDYPQPRAALALAKMCQAETIENLTNQRKVDIRGICPAIQLFLARLYYCDLGPKP